MFTIDVETAESYLRQAGQLQGDQLVEIRRLAGGVSNEVFYVAIDKGDDFVLKQARGRLRVADPWFCSVERIWREVEVLRICQRVLAGCQLSVEIPQVLFEDRENFCFAMTAAPLHHTVWKQQLLDGDADPTIAQACGQLMGTLHARTWQEAEIDRQLEDRQFFNDLRLDPYYRYVASVHDDLQEAMQHLIDSVWQNRWCLVHGDFSPKNLLVFDNRLMLIDCEVGHYGDPAFDIGFFLSHLILKAIYQSPKSEPYINLTELFFRAYQEPLAKRIAGDQLQNLIARAVQNFAGCLLARVDGKSKVEYLSDSQHRDQVRLISRTLFHEQPASWQEVLAVIRKTIDSK